MLIGLIGLKGSGKDAVGDVLCNSHRFVRTSYAEPIKRSVQRMLKLNRSEYDEFKRSAFVGNGDTKLVINGRDFVVGVGMVMRDQDSGQFVRRVQTIVDSNKNVVVTDVRFANEVDHIRMNGGVLIEIRRPNTTKGSHISEHLPGTVDVDYVVDNTSTLEALAVKIQRLLSKRITTCQ